MNSFKQETTMFIYLLVVWNKGRASLRQTRLVVGFAKGSVSVHHSFSFTYALYLGHPSTTVTIVKNMLCFIVIYNDNCASNIPSPQSRSLGDIILLEVTRVMYLMVELKMVNFLIKTKYLN